MMKVKKKGSKSKQEIHIENYLTKNQNMKREYGRSWYQNMPEENKHRLKKYPKKNYRKAKKINIKIFHFFFLYLVQNEKWKKNLWFFINSGLIKNHFTKLKRLISINKVEIKRIVLFKKLIWQKRFI